LETSLAVQFIKKSADPGGRAVWGLDLRPLAY
jgi:hypothetical protein